MKRIFSAVAGTIILIFGMLYSCQHDPVVPPATVPDTIYSPCQPEVVYFQNQVLPMLTSNCAKSGCHDASTHQEGINMTTYENIYATGRVVPGEPEQSRLYQSLLSGGENRMPPGQPLSDAQIKLVYDWIRQGARNLYCENLACDTSVVNYPHSVYPIFQTYCLGCHTGSTQQGGGIDLTNYATVSGLAANGNLVGSITHAAGYSAMPKNMPPLSDCQIATIRKWVRDTTFVPSECDSSNVNYPHTVFPVFQQYCNGCHSGNPPQGALDLTNYAQVATIAQNGRLVGSITHATGYSAMPKAGGQLDPCLIALIKKWIRDTTFVNPVGHPCDPDTVYFEYDLLPILVSNCAKSGCHDATTHAHGIRYVSYAATIQTGGVVPYNPGNSDMYKAVTDNGDDLMPPPPNTPLTQAQISLIYKWIQQGAQNLHCDNVNCDSTNATYASPVSGIISTHCLGCHTGAGAGGGISLATYNDLVTVANNGKLWGSISWLSGYSPMPKNGSKLPQCSLSQIHKWIENGLPANKK